MIPCIGTSICGETYYPLYNNQAMFRIQEGFGDGALEKIAENTRASFRLAFDIFCVLCDEGEAVRRLYGYDPGATPDWKEAERVYSPADIALLKEAVFAAVTLGCTREADISEEIDIVLVELKKKKG